MAFMTVSESLRLPIFRSTIKLTAAHITIQRHLANVSKLVQFAVFRKLISVVQFKAPIFF